MNSLSLRSIAGAACVVAGMALAVLPVEFAMIDVWLFGAGLGLVIVGFLLVYFRKRPFDVLSPVVGLPTLIFLYSWAGALLVEASGGGDGGFASGDTVAKYYQACSLGILFLLTGIIVARDRGRTGPELLIPLPRNFGLALCMGAVVLGSATIPWWGGSFDPTSATLYAERSLSLRVERMSNAASGLGEVFLVQLPTGLILALCTWVLFSSKRIWLRVLAGIVILDFLLVQLLSGWRGAFIYGASIVLCFYHYRISRLTIARAVAGGVAAYVLINGIAIARISNEPREMLEQVSGTVGKEGLAAFGLVSSGEFVASANFFEIIDAIDTRQIDYQWGQGWINEFLVFIPRLFFSNRPPTMSEQFVLTFHPGVLESGGGYGFFIIQEGYWQFGLLGVCLTMFLYGFLVERIYRRVVLKGGSEAHVLAYGFLYSALILGAPRSGALLSFKVACINIIGIAAVWVLAGFITTMGKATQIEKGVK